MNEFDATRIKRMAELSAEPVGRAALTVLHGQVWDTNELQADFQVISFLTPYVRVKRRTDGVEGTLEFQARPRFYFRFVPTQTGR